jgi:hypothetical protein
MYNTHGAVPMSPLERLARRASAFPSFLGHALAAYQRAHGLTDADLAARLGCPVERLANVRLCGAVRADHFAEDVKVIADRFGLRVDALEDVCWPW